MSRSARSLRPKGRRVRSIGHAWPRAAAVFNWAKKRRDVVRLDIEIRRHDRGPSSLLVVFDFEFVAASAFPEVRRCHVVFSAEGSASETYTAGVLTKTLRAAKRSALGLPPLP